MASSTRTRQMTLQEQADVYWKTINEQEGVIQRLRGQLQNCVNHLDRAKRKYPTRSYDNCIESANKALYETPIK